MSRSRSGFGGYRGRKTLHDILIGIAVALAVLVLLVLAGLFLGQEYIIFTDEGMRLDLPFFQKEEQERPGPGNVSVEIEPKGELPEDPDKVPAMAAMELPLEAVLDGSALQKLETAGADALVLEMKDREGRLHWNTQQEDAVRAGVSAGDQSINEKLKRWNQGEVYTVARVCCFRDNTMPYHYNRMALRAGYGNWRDELGLRWLNPDKEESRTYLAALCGELAELGFDEILLEQCSFPTQGKLEAIAAGGVYETGGFDGVTERFLTQVRQALEPYGTTLSVRLDRSAAGDLGQSSGLTPAVLDTCAERIWMAEDEGSPTPEEILNGMELSDRLVRITDGVEARHETPQAVLTEE